jgi:prepilin signal peptidase PulO-like enzyme (type II secretory pathway)
LLFLAVILKSGPAGEAIAELWFVAIIIALIFIDARHKLLPDVITYPAFVLALVVGAVLAVLEQYPRYTAYPPLSTLKELINQPESSFGMESSFRQAALLGALLIACATPIFWFIDRVDEVLFGKYFEWAEDDKTLSTPEEIEGERKAQQRHDRVVYGAIAAGVILAMAWVVFGYLGPYENPMNYQIAYASLLRAGLGALVGGGLIWLLRALYFYTRGAEGMGLGDVKMMAVVGAFLGWQQAILVLILGSFLGSAVGLMMARRSKEGLKTALPFGIFLGIAALVSLFAGTPIMRWYIEMMQP